MQGVMILNHHLQAAVQDPRNRLHGNSTRPMLRKYPLPFGISTAAYQVHSSARWPSCKTSWIREKTFSQLVGSDVSSPFGTYRQSQRCSIYILGSPTNLILRRSQTNQATSSYLDKESSTRKGFRVTRFFYNRGVGYSPIEVNTISCNNLDGYASRGWGGGDPWRPCTTPTYGSKPPLPGGVWMQGGSQLRFLMSPLFFRIPPLLLPAIVILSHRGSVGHDVGLIMQQP